MTNCNFILGSKTLLNHPLLVPHADTLRCVENSSQKSGQQAHHQFKLFDTNGVLSLQDLRNTLLPPMTSQDLVKEWYLRINSFRGKQEPISKALGQRQAVTGLVIDTTAGLGRDSMVLAKTGCHVIMIERELSLACLLQQALEFAQQEPWFQNISGSVKLRVGEATHYFASEKSILDFTSQTHISAYYCDPMFSHKANKSANNKRLIQTLQSLCHRNDHQRLDRFLLDKLQPNQRLIIKRAPHESALKPFLNYQLKGSAFRLDVHFRS